jgi:3-hydroxybutyryl-CoA dehydrogenase
MEIKTIGVIGAGQWGRQIACAALLGGFQTILEDVSSDMLEQGVAHIRQSLDESVARGQLTLEQKDAAIARLSTANRADEVCREADMLIETVPEEMEVKLEIFTIFDKFAKPDAILASHTALSITEIAAITFRTENCVGMRFVDRGREKTTLEIVRGADTSYATVATCVNVGLRLGMETLVIRDDTDHIADDASTARFRAKGVPE